jgi:tRNA pseudouridine38-40 synthase
LAPGGFHAQWTPSTKEYRYRLCFGEVPKAWSGYAWGLGSEPHLEGAEVSSDTLVQALREARGTRDFFAFHAASSTRRLRTLSQVEVGRGLGGAVWELRLQGSGFGRYQVRALVGGAALVAAGRLKEAAWRAALKDGVRFEGMLAPPQGLTLWALDYGSLGPFDTEATARLPGGPPFDGLG